MSNTRIRVAERGHADVDRTTWRRLSDREDFWRLVEGGVLGVGRPSRERVRLDGKCFVGRAALGDMVLEVTEKVPGSLAALLSHASRGAFRVERLPAPASDAGDLLSLLAREYVHAVRRYVNRGREFRYASAPKSGSLVGGRIDVTRTAGLRARGLRHLIAFDRTVLTRDTPMNRVLFAALREVGRLAPAVGLDAVDVAAARSLTMLFGDCAKADVLFSPRLRLAGEAEELAAGTPSEPDRDLLSLAAVILYHQSFEVSTISDATVPRSWFLNLETLFETAVRRIMADRCGPTARVTGSPRPAPPIFDATPGGYTANPDLLVRASGDVLAAGDVKYKQWTGRPDEDDLYQLLAHAATFGAPKAFLVYPHEAFETVHLGVAPTGCETWAFAVDVGSLVADLAEVLNELRVPVERP